MEINITEDDITAARLMGATGREVLVVAVRRMLQREYPGADIEVHIPENCAAVGMADFVLAVAD